MHRLDKDFDGNSTFLKECYPQKDAKEGTPGFCPVERDPHNPDEIALPTITEVSPCPFEHTTESFESVRY